MNTMNFVLEKGNRANFCQSFLEIIICSHVSHNASDILDDIFPLFFRWG